MVSSKTLALTLSAFAVLAQAAPQEDGLLARASRFLASPFTKRSSSSASATSNNGFVSAAYFANWDTGFSVSDLPIQHLSHVNYAFGDIGTDGTCSLGNSGTDSKNLQQLFALKQKNRKLKTALALGGGGAPGWKHINAGSFTTNFVKSAVALVQQWGLDGLDLDFEFPSTSNIAAYTTLIQALRKSLDALAAELKTTPFTISVAVAGDIKDTQAYQDYIKKIDASIDYWNVMAYDLCASNYQKTACDIGNLSGGSPSGSGTIQWFITNGGTPAKMVLGSPLYGYTYGGVTAHGGSYDKSKTPKGDGDNGPGGYGVKNFPISSMKNAKITEDLETGASWAYDAEAKMLASYDTPKIAAVKAAWVMKQEIGGAMYWEISSDAEGDASLVATFGKAFSSGGGLHAACNHLSFPSSSNSNIKNGGSNAASCDDSAPNTSAASSSSSSSSGDAGDDTTGDHDTTTGDDDTSGDDTTSASTGKSQHCSATSTTRRAKRHNKRRLYLSLS